MDKIIYILLIIIFVTIFYFLNYNFCETRKYLWSKRYIDYNDYNSMETEYISDEKTILNQINNCNDYIWIRNTSNDSNVKTDLDYFGNLLKHIKKPIILITTDGDRSVPSSYDKNLVNKILSSDKIIKWYTQNYDKSVIHPKLRYYPIGLDMHTKKWLVFKYFDKYRSSESLRYRKFNNYLKMNNSDINKNKKNRIFCDSHLSLSHPRRKEMYETLKRNKMVDFLNEKVNHNEIMKKYSEYRFVLSPIGNGLDCHRTWEVFLLGSIVITETSALDDMFIENNLPVIILKNFKDINGWNELHRLRCIVGYT